MEALILRRNYPRPVTFADLRRVIQEPTMVRPCTVVVARQYADVMVVVYRLWHAALKSAIGATDDVYAVVDGREVLVARVRGMGEAREGFAFGATSRQILDVLIKADEQGYWERPHEVRLDLRAQGATDAASTLGA